MTRRDLRGERKESGQPSEIGRSFERSEPVWIIQAVGSVGQLVQRRVWLQVNGDIREDGNMDWMIWSVPEMISNLSEYVESAAGDVFLSGTPSEVGPVSNGGRMKVSIEGLVSMSAEVV